MKKHLLINHKNKDSYMTRKEPEPLLENERKWKLEIHQMLLMLCETIETTPKLIGLYNIK